MTELEQLKAKRDDLNRRIEELEALDAVARRVQKALRDIADGFDNGHTRIYSLNERCNRASYHYWQHGVYTVDTKIELCHLDLGKIELRMEREKSLCR